MDNITKIKSIVENIGRANKILMSSSLIQEHKQELYDVLLDMSKTPLEYDKIFTEYRETLASREKYDDDNKEKIYVPMTLTERKENIEQALSIIQDSIPKLEKQLESMKNKGYFVPEGEITKYKKIWIQKPNPKLVGSRGIYNEVPTKIKFTKKEFTLNDIESLIKKLKNIKEESDLFIKSLNSIELLGNPFANPNIQQAQEKCLQNRKEIMGVYKVINSQFGRGDIPKRFFDKECDYDGHKRTKILQMIGEKGVSVREDQEFINIQNPIDKSSSRRTTRTKYTVDKGNNLICTIPEIDTLFTIGLSDIKNIPNPEYPKAQDQLKQLKETTDQISTILLSTKE